MFYPAVLEGNEKEGYTVTFPDIPEAITQIDNYQDLQKMGLDCLLTSFSFYYENKKPIPYGSEEFDDGSVGVYVPPSSVAKMILVNTMIRNNVRPCDLAKKLNVKPQEVTRLVNFKHKTKLDTLVDAIFCADPRIQLMLKVI